MKTSTLLTALVVAGLTTAAATPGLAADTLKLAIGQRGNWDTAVAELGTRAGIFKKHGLTLEMTYTGGSGETLQPVVSNSVDIGVAVGTLGAISVFAKGAPVRIIGAEATGAADYWYAKAGSGIKSLKDANGHTIAFSSRGSSTESVVRAFIAENKLHVKPTPTGSPPATLTAVMTGQVDIGWAAPPFGIKEMDEGKIVMVARATDAAIVRGQTIRVLVTNTATLQKKKDALLRFMQAYRETIDYMYDGDKVLKDYAEFAHISVPLAKRVRDHFFPKSLIAPDSIKGMDTLLVDAVNLKFITKPLTSQQVKELVQVPLK